MRKLRLSASVSGSGLDFGIVVQSMFIMMSSIGCGAISTLLSKFSCAMSRAVSVAAQKNGGDSPQPICSASGITNWIGSPALPPGRTYAKFHASSALTHILQ